LDVTGSLRVTSFILLGGEISGPSNTYFNGPTINTGTFYLRYANASLPNTYITNLSTTELTVSGGNTVSSVVGTGVVSFRIGNTTSGATWFFENNRNAPAGSLEITNSISNAGVTLFTTRNVGINTNSDAGFKLDVNGTARVSGNTSIVGTLTTRTVSAYNVTETSSNSGDALVTAQTNGQAQFIALRAIGSSNSSITNFQAKVIIQAPSGTFLTTNSAGTPTNTDVSQTWHQSKSISINSVTEYASAQFAIDSTTKGFLPPRMTTTQKNAIASPTAGLMVFDTTLVKLCVHNGTTWETITSV
jgi:hypothetical protein